MYCSWRSNYEEGVWNPINGLTPSHMCACTKTGHGFPTSYLMVFLYVQMSCGER
jgi:hypothetical protein